MRRLAIITVLGLFLGVAAVAQDSDAEAATRPVVEKVLRLAQELNYDGLAKISLYAGRDMNRYLKVKINMWDPHEKVELENTCNEINRVVTRAVSWNSTDFGADGTCYFWDVQFTDARKKTKVYGVMLGKLDGQYLFARFQKRVGAKSGRKSGRKS